MEHLLEEGLIYSLDGVIIGYDDIIEYNPFLAKIATFLFSSPAVYFYPIIFVFNVVMLILHPNIRPSSSSAVIINGYSGLNAFIFFLLSGLITSLHEFGHFLAGVRYGVFVRIQLSLRMCFLVVESDINGIWAAKKRQRDLCYLAGFYFESIIMLFMILAQLLSKNAHVIKCSSIIILILSLNFIWQFLIFLRTDLYLIILNHLEVESLHAAFLERAKSLISGEHIRFEKIHILYAAIYTMGTIASFFYLMGFLRIYCSLAIIAIHNIIIKDNFWDSFFLLLTLIIAVILWIIGYQNRRKESV